LNQFLKKKRNIVAGNGFCSNRKPNIHFYKDKIEQLSQKKKSKPTNSMDCKVPSNFSFLENCEETCDFFERIALHSDNNKVKKIFFDQGNCKNIDLCAESVAAVLLKDLSKEKRIVLRGSYPMDENLKHIVRASGVTKYLKISNDCPDDMIIFDMKEGRKTAVKPNISTEKELQSSKLIEHLNRCLINCGWKLKNSGKEHLGKIIGEVLDNAECHSKRPLWWINAYLRTIGEKKGECQLVIFNFGRSIYESMQDLPIDNDLRKEIELLVAEHSKKKFFSQSWDKEVLWTLYSLQEGVSRFSGSKNSKDRGQGLPDLIEFFQQIGKCDGKEPVMALISGNTFIKFDNDYLISIKEADGARRRQIAFNKANDLHIPPDSTKVVKLKHFFPGTICSFKFYIDNKYLESLKNGK